MDFFTNKVGKNVNFPGRGKTMKKVNNASLKQSMFERMFPSEKASRGVNNTNTTKELAQMNEKNTSRPSSPEELSVSPSENVRNLQSTPKPIGGKRSSKKRSSKKRRSSRKVRKSRRA